MKLFIIIIELIIQEEIIEFLRANVDTLTKEKSTIKNELEYKTRILDKYEEITGNRTIKKHKIKFIMKKKK